MSMPVMRDVRAWAQRRQANLPAGYGWRFVISVDLTMAVIGVAALLQRPASDWPLAVLAGGVAVIPWMVFFLFNVCTYEGLALWASWTAATAILLFCTSTPISGDFAPLLLSLSVGTVTAVTSGRGGVLAAVSACALLVGAAVTNRIQAPVLYMAFIGIGLLVGYLVRTQQQSLLAQRAMQTELATHVAADERRRIAREVHDVIAHSLSVTLLHLTAARHLLEYGDDGDDAVRALHQAEQLGRQAMADIRRTVGLLDTGSQDRAPEPGIGDIGALTQDFARAGLDVTLELAGSVQDVSAAVGLALYRIAQESLANVAKHAPDSGTVLTLTVSSDAATLKVVNGPTGAADVEFVEGRGLLGMRQRVELLGGTIDIGSGADGWAVIARVPAAASEAGWPSRIGAS